MNADALLKGNLYSYCNNSPITSKDPNGKYSSSIVSDDDEEEIFISKESYEFYLFQQARAQEVYDIIEEYSNTVRMGKYPSLRYNTISNVLTNCDLFTNNFRGENDSGCAMFVRAVILGIPSRHSDNEYFAGASSMFNNDMIIADNISKIGGPKNLIPGMILGSRIKDSKDDGQYHIEHVGIYAGLHNFGKGPEPAVYSFNTDTNCRNLRPFSSYKDPWVYFGWHKGTILD